MKTLTEAMLVSLKDSLVYDTRHKETLYPSFCTLKRGDGAAIVCNEFQIKYLKPFSSFIMNKRS